MSFNVGRINFINTAPVYYGIDTGRVECPGETVEGSPAALNGLLERGELQVSAISSAAYSRVFPRWLILPRLSISARGPVRSVLLCLREPLQPGRRLDIGLSDKSETAKALARIVLENVNETEPTYHDVKLSKKAPEGLDGFLVIGDDALKLNFRDRYPHVMDLGEFWFKWTGLPFVFGLWAVDRAFAKAHPEETALLSSALLHSKDLGKRAVEDAARLASLRAGVPEELCRIYLRHIEYDLDEDHLKGLHRFFRLMKERGEIGESVEPAIWEADLDA